MTDLLVAPAFRAVVGGREERLSLPALLAALMRDEVESMTALRPHQRHAWHMFLAYLCALALFRGGRDDIPEEAEDWASLLLELTGGAAEPWTLVVADLSKPAFLQPPVPEETVLVLKNTIPTPDALDVLITAKYFDLKSEVATEADLDDWVFAFVSLQTMEGFLGAGNYGIARMNGGFSARPFLGLAPAGGPGAHLRRDVRGLLASREKTLDFHEFYDEEGLALVWLEPWDGTVSLPVTRLDPWFIEICRRVRFVLEEGGFSVRSVGTKGPRTDAKALNGVTGDFWAPVNIAENKAFSLDARGFSHRVLVPMLFGQNATRKFDLPPALRLLSGEGDMTLVARGIVRGQGKTEGFHERLVPISRAVACAMTNDEEQTLARIANAQQGEIAQIASALRFACGVVALGGAPEKPGKTHYAQAEPFTRRLEAEAEAAFFQVLGERYVEGDPARARWLGKLIKVARDLLAEAVETIPCRSQHRWRARVRAPGAFFGALWKGPLANDREIVFPKKEEADA
jgi:CRISPR system Cascade subunit CasA